jgi:apolipoprotein N-acyltransferase
VPRPSLPSLPGIPVRVRGPVLAVLAGLAIAASVPPWGCWPLAFVGVALWDRAIADASWLARGRRSWLVGVTWLLPSMVWMWDLTAPGYLVAVVAFATYFAVAAAMVPPAAPARWIGLPAAIVLAEIARWTLPFGGVPLSTLAMSQAAAPVGQTARLGTAIFVSGVVAVGGVALAAAASRRWRAAGVGVAVVATMTVLALVAPRGSDVAPLTFALVQGGGPQRTRAATTDEREVFERHVAATDDVTTPVDLVVWPENVVAVEGPLGDTGEGDEVVELARRLDTTLVVGATEGVDQLTFRNASIVYSPEGESIARYDKVRRVPFGEYVPFRGLVERLTDETSGLSARDAVAGAGPAVVDTPAGPLAIVISWEVFFTNRVREGVLAGGEIVLNPTNGSSYWLTQVQSQQIASSQLRAIESGRWVLQAAPTGFSAVVEPDGTVEQRTGISERAVLQGTAARRRGDTLATRIGPQPTVLLAGVALGAAWVVDRRRHRDRAGAEALTPRGAG